MNFIQRFKVAARKAIYFQKRLSKLGPMYLTCNEKQSDCTRRNADPRNGCPTCEYTIQRAIMLKELQDELRNIPGGTWKGELKWPKEYLLSTVTEIAGVSISTKKRNPKWPVVLDTMVSIYRNELSRMKAFEMANSPAFSQPGTVLTQGKDNANK